MNPQRCLPGAHYKNFMPKKKSKSIVLRWLEPSEAKHLIEGCTVLIQRLDRSYRESRGVEVVGYFRPDWVENENGYGTEPMRFANLNNLVRV